MASSLKITEACVRSCYFCGSPNSPYVCPRCNLTYCSLECYKSIKHMNCSESFYQEWVTSELKMTRSSVEDRKIVEDIIRRVHHQNEEQLDSDDDDDVGDGDNDDDCYPDLSQRFSEVNLDRVENFDDMWKCLNHTEKEEFSSLIKTGEAAKLLTLWDPWWLSKTKLQLVQELEDNVQNNYSDPCPLIQQDIPPLKQLLSVSPSPHVKYDIVNVLYGYAYVTRLYNGDQFDFAVEAVENILKISRSLGKNQRWNNCDEAITDAILQLEQHKDVINSTGFIVEVIADVKSIIEGPDHTNLTKYILAAISDMGRLFKNAKDNLKKQQKMSKQKSTGSFVVKLREVEKKLQFFLSWTKDYFHELPPVIAELDLLHAVKLKEMVAFEELQKDVAAGTSKLLSTKCGAKIEEIN